MTRFRDFMIAFAATLVISGFATVLAFSFPLLFGIAALFVGPSLFAVGIIVFGPAAIATIFAFSAKSTARMAGMISAVLVAMLCFTMPSRVQTYRQLRPLTDAEAQNYGALPKAKTGKVDNIVLINGASYDAKAILIDGGGRNVFLLSGTQRENIASGRIEGDLPYSIEQWSLAQSQTCDPPPNREKNRIWACFINSSVQALPSKFLLIAHETAEGKASTLAAYEIGNGPPNLLMKWEQKALTDPTTMFRSEYPNRTKFVQFITDQHRSARLLNFIFPP